MFESIKNQWMEKSKEAVTAITGSKLATDGPNGVVPPMSAGETMLVTLGAIVVCVLIAYIVTCLFLLLLGQVHLLSDYKLLRQLFPFTAMRWDITKIGITAIGVLGSVFCIYAVWQRVQIMKQYNISQYSDTVTTFLGFLVQPAVLPLITALVVAVLLFGLIYVANSLGGEFMAGILLMGLGIPGFFVVACLTAVCAFIYAIGAIKFIMLVLK